MNRSIFVLLFCSCLFAQSRSSIMPAAMLNFDSLVQLPATPEETINPTLKDFPTLAIDSGSLCKKNGLLISEKKAAMYLFYQYGYQRQAKELQVSKYLLNVYDSIARAVEKNIYWSELDAKDVRIAALEKSNIRGFWEKNTGLFGGILGVAAAVLTEYAVIKTAK